LNITPLRPSGSDLNTPLPSFIESPRILDVWIQYRKWLKESGGVLNWLQ